ncbi:interleukin-1 receptor accessory protein-like 1-A, partial [Pimephales promelas]
QVNIAGNLRPLGCTLLLGTSRVMGTGVIPHLEKEDCTTALPKSTLLTMQEQDGTVSRVVYYIRRHKRPDKRERAKEPRSVIKLLKHWNKLTLQDGMLFKVKRDHNMNKQLYQFIVPDCLKQQVLHGIHDAAGHQGRSRTLSLARHRFFWTGMAHDIVHYVRNCKRCIVGKTPEPDARAPLENIHTTEPMELICIDFWSAEQGDKSVDVLVATDHFTKMAFAFPCKNQSAKQVARRLWDDIFCIYGFPKRVHSDQGANFTSKLIKELLDMAEIKKSHTTPYHPMGNGITERFNRTLGSMIRALPPKSKAKWPQSLRVLTFCYNCTVHETTGFAPFYLMFGRIPRLPIDVMFQHVLKNDLVITHSEFVSNLKRDLSEAAKVAQRHSSAEQARHAKLYDRKVKGSPLTVGDRVLLANRGERGKRKVADKWESTAYEVLSVRSAINVYRVKDTVTGKEKTVHRNLLLPVSFLLRDHEVDLSSDSLSVGARSDQGDPLPCEQLDSDEKTLRWILQSGENAELDEVVVMIPSSSNPVENTHVDDVVDDSHGCTGQDRDVSQSSFLDDQSAHSHSVQLPTDSPADPHSHVPSSVDSESDEPVVNQPRRGMTMTRIGLCFILCLRCHATPDSFWFPLVQSEAQRRGRQSEAQRRGRQSEAQRRGRQSEAQRRGRQSEAQRRGRQGEAQRRGRQSEAQRRGRQGEAQRRGRQSEAQRRGRQSEAQRRGRQSEAQRRGRQSEAQRRGRQSEAQRRGRQSEAQRRGRQGEQSGHAHRGLANQTSPPSPPAAARHRARHTRWAGQLTHLNWRCSAHLKRRCSAHLKRRFSAHLKRRCSAHLKRRFSAHLNWRCSAHLKRRFSAHLNWRCSAHLKRRCSAHLKRRFSAHLKRRFSAHLKRRFSAHLKRRCSAHLKRRFSAHLKRRFSAHLKRRCSAHLKRRCSAH